MGIVLTLASGFSHPDLTKLTKKTKSLQNSFNFIAFRLYYGLLLYLFSLCVSLSIMIILFVFSLANQNSFLCPRLHLLSELLSCCQAARQQEKLSPQRQSQATAQKNLFGLILRAMALIKSFRSTFMIHKTKENDHVFPLTFNLSFSEFASAIKCLANFLLFSRFTCSAWNRLNVWRFL